MLIKKLFPQLVYLVFLVFFSLHAHAQQQPIPDWVKDIGGTGESKLTGIGVDKFDNVYVAGNFQATLTVDHSGISTPKALTSQGSYDIFIAKYTSDGKLVWAKSIGGGGLDQVNNLAVDPNGNVIIGASFNSSSIDCDPGPATFNITNNGSDDALIVKLDTDGNFLWAKSFGGFNVERGHVVTTDNLGNVVFVGSFSSPTINPGGITLTSNGSFDGFVVKFDPNGNTLWAFRIGSFSDDEIKSVKTDSNNDILVMGYFSGSVDLNPKGTPFPLTKAAQTYFVGKYSSNGLLVWANEIASTNTVTVSSIAVGPTNDVFLTGVYAGRIDFKSPANTISLNAVGTYNLFVSKYNSSGTTAWARNITGTAVNPYSYYITADVENSVYIGGFFDQSLTFSDGTTSKTITYHGGRDTFFGKFSGTGDYLWAFNFGSNCTGNYGHKIAVDSKKNVLLGGAFCSTVDFNPSTCNLNITAKHANSDGYISKFNQVKLTGDALIVSFELAEQAEPAVIDNVNKRIKIKVKEGTDITKLRPTLKTDIGVLNPLSDTEQDFTSPKTYTISSNCIDYLWTVEVTVATSGKAEVCSEESVKLTGAAVSNSTFQWEIKDTNGNWVNATGNATLADYEFNAPTNNGNADIIVELRRKVTSNSASIYDSEYTITVHALTTNNIISAAQTLFCNGKATVNLTGTAPTGATHITAAFIWQQSTNGTDWNNIANTNAKDFSPPEFYQTTYFRRITKSNLCDAYSNVLKIEVVPAVTVANAGNDVQLCNTSSLTLAANEPGPNETGTWQVISPASYTAAFTPANINNPKASIANLPENEEIILRWTIKQNNCGDESYAEIKVYNYANPIISMPASVTINEGQSVVIPATFTPVPNISYVYTWSPSAGLDDPAKLNPTASPLQTTIYHLTVAYGKNCSVTSAIKIIVDKITKVDVCSRGTLMLTGEVNNDQQPIFQWQKLVNGTWTDLQNENQPNMSLTADENLGNTIIQVNYRRKIVDNNTVYFDSKFEISISPTTFNNIIATSTSVFCTGSVNNLFLSGSTPNGASNANISFGWEQSDDGVSWQPFAGTAKDLSISILSKTAYFRRVTNADNCKSLSNILKIEVYPIATIANAGTSKNYCGIAMVKLDANEVLNNETGTWEVVSPTGYNPFAGQSLHNPKATIYNLPQDQPVVLRWTIDNNSCNTSTSSEITLLSYHQIALQASNNLYLDFGKTINLGVSANLNSNLPYVFEWSPAKGLDRTDVLSPNANPTENTTYTLNVRYGEDCVQTIAVTVRVLNEIKIPNTFSPNADGINDTWEIKNIANYSAAKVTIYNRYGTPVYQSNTYQSAWDGKHNGKPLPVGVYYYIIDLYDKKSTKSYNGSVTIIR